LDDSSEGPLSNQLPAPEIGLSDHFDQVTKTMIGFDNIIGLDAQPKIKDVALNEVSNNLNSIINSKAYISPYEINFAMDVWFKNPVENPLIPLIQKDSALGVILNGNEDRGNVDLRKDINTIFSEGIVLNEESSNEEDVKDAFRITDTHYEESIVYSSGNTYQVAPS
jgi:hypothetical protein